jgi:membrane protease YdiL (CAAX protease family)
MMALANFDWGWLLGALLLGLAVGWISVVHRGPALSKNAAMGIGGVAAVLVGLALARLVPGRAGYWLDLFLVMIVAYLIGSAIGSWLRYWVVSRQAQATDTAGET